MNVLENTLQLLNQGKTKMIWGDPHTHEILIENTDRITGYNGNKERFVRNKAAYATMTTANCFRLLEAHGIPTHFVAPSEETNYFWARKLTMIPVEFVVRYQAYGSYLQRYPSTQPGAFFSKPIFETFEKDDSIGDPLLVVDKNRGIVRWYDPDTAEIKSSSKERLLKEASYLFIDRWDEARKLALNAANVLRTFWADRNMLLVDIKIECGITNDDQVIIGDTIDNECWRLWRTDDCDQSLGRPLMHDITSNEIHQSFKDVYRHTNAMLARLNARQPPK